MRPERIRAAQRARHLIVALGACSAVLAAVGFSFGLRGYLALAGADASAALGTVSRAGADLGIAALVGLCLIAALVVLAAVLLARLQRLAAYAGATRVGARQQRNPGVTSHRAWEERLVIELDQSRRLGYPVTVAVLEIAHHARYVAQHGEAAGERLLADFARAAAHSLRGADVFTRFGACQFALLLPQCPAHQASALLDRLLALVPEGQTFSAGVAAWHWRESSSTLIERAFAALAQARADHVSAVEVAPGLPVNVDRPMRRLATNATP